MVTFSSILNFAIYTASVALAAGCLGTVAAILVEKALSNREKHSKPTQKLERGQVYGRFSEGSDMNNPFNDASMYGMYIAITDVRPPRDGKGMPYFQYIYLDDNRKPNGQSLVYTIQLSKNFAKKWNLVGTTDLDSVELVF